MPRPGVYQIPAFRKVSMERLLKQGGHAYTTTKQVALHAGVPESVVKEHLVKMRLKDSILKTSPFYKK